jgi:N-acetylglutamate synthase-like GNAT family acetyltransferase
MVVRSARLEDADPLARLFGQLGHPQSRDAFRDRLQSVLGDPRADVLVADERGTLVGAAACYFVPVAHDDRPWCRITTLVVDEAKRGQGIGHRLVEAAEKTAQDASCSRIEATSGLHRAEAHRLYDSLDYGRTSAHFLKRF